MKFKTTLFGLLAASAIWPYQAHTNDNVHTDLEEDIYQDSVVMDLDGKEASAAAASKLEAEKEAVTLTLEGNILVGGSMDYTEETALLQGMKGFGWADVKINATQPFAKDKVKIDLCLRFAEKELCTKRAVVSMPYLMAGYDMSCLAYTKGDSSLPVAAGVSSPLQIRYQYATDTFRCYAGFEKALEAQVGGLDENGECYVLKEKKEGKEEKTAEEKTAMDVQTAYPAFGLGFGINNTHIDFGISGLLRGLTKKDVKDAGSKAAAGGTAEDPTIHLTYGVQVGFTYNILPDNKHTVALQWIYANGLSDYVSHLSGMQKDKKRKEAVAVYMKKDSSDANVLHNIKTFSGGIAWNYKPTAKWNLGLSVAAFKNLAEDKPVKALDIALAIKPAVSYNLNKSWTLFTEVNYTGDHQNNAITDQKVNASGGMKYSFTSTNA